MPHLVNYAVELSSSDRTALALLQDVRKSLYRLDAAARKDRETTTEFDQFVRDRQVISNLIQEDLFPKPPEPTGSPIRDLLMRGPLGTMFQGLGLALLAEGCDKMLGREFGKEARELQQTWQSFRQHARTKAGNNEAWARSAYVVASAPSVEWIESQLAAARARSNAASVAAAVALLGILAIGLGAAAAAGSRPGTAQQCYSLNSLPCLEQDQHAFCVKWDWSVPICPTN